MHLSSSPPGPLLLWIKGCPLILVVEETTKSQLFSLDKKKSPSPCRTDTIFHGCRWVGDRRRISHSHTRLILWNSYVWVPTREDSIRKPCHAEKSITHSIKGGVHCAFLSAALAMTKLLSCYQPREQGQGQHSSDVLQSPFCLPHLPWDTTQLGSLLRHLPLFFPILGELFISLTLASLSENAYVLRWKLWRLRIRHLKIYSSILTF